MYYCYSSTCFKVFDYSCTGNILGVPSSEHTSGDEFDYTEWVIQEKNEAYFEGFCGDD